QGYDRPFFLHFFFQAEDGIRDKLVTGVQTCALPILGRHEGAPSSRALHAYTTTRANVRRRAVQTPNGAEERREEEQPREHLGPRSEERRVGKECRAWRVQCDLYKKKDCKIELADIQI